MRIADSHDDNCIRKLTYMLEQLHPGVIFQMHIGHTSIIDVPEKEIAIWENSNPGIWNSIFDFCNGFITGWECARDN